MSVKIKKGCLIEAFNDNKVNIILHCCNMQNKFGKGIAHDIKQHFPLAYKADTFWYKWDKNLSSKKLEKKPNNLTVFYSYSAAKIKKGKYIFNLYGQEFYGKDKRYLNYGLFTEALFAFKCKLYSLGIEEPVIGIPYKIGCGNAGGDWETVLELIEHYLREYKVIIYKDK